MNDENQLRQRVQAGEAAALPEYLQCVRSPLLAYIDRNLGAALRTKVEAQDVFQDTAVAAIHALPKAHLSDRDPFGWLCQIVHQRIADVSRKHHAQKRGNDREVALHAPAGDSSRNWMSLLAASLTSPSQAVIRDERHIQLFAAIAELPSDVQDVLRWRYVDDLPTKEIAARIGKTDGAVRVLLTRAVQKLQGLIAE